MQARSSTLDLAPSTSIHFHSAQARRNLNIVTFRPCIISCKDCTVLMGSNCRTMKSISARAISKCLGFSAAVCLSLAVALPAQAKPTTDKQTLEILSIEAPLVRVALERAALMERSAPISRNQQYAARLYCVAARLGSLEAQFRLGKMILAGWGMRESLSDAVGLFRIAAGQGHEQAANVLAGLKVQTDSLPECMLNPGPSIDSEAERANLSVDPQK